MGRSRDKAGLERRAARGDLEAAAKVLNDRVAAGTLAADMLCLAAHVGDEAAKRAVGPPWCACGLPHVIPPWLSCVDLVDWARAVGAQFCLKAIVRVALAGVQPAQDAWEESQAADRGLKLEVHMRDGGVKSAPVTILNADALDKYHIDSRPRRALDAVRAWLEDPEKAAPLLVGKDLITTPSASWAPYVARLVSTWRVGTAGERAEIAVAGAYNYSARGEIIAEAFDFAVRYLGAIRLDLIRESIRREVVPWALAVVSPPFKPSARDTNLSTGGGLPRGRIDRFWKTPGT